MVQNAQWGPPVLLLKVFKDCEKDRVTIAWRNRSEAGADLLVTRERLDAEAGRSVIVSLTLVALAVVLQKRRRLHAKAAKGTSGSVLYRVTGMGAGFANGGEANGVLTQNRLEMIEAEGLGPRGLLVANGRPPARSRPPCRVERSRPALRSALCAPCAPALRSRECHTSRPCPVQSRTLTAARLRNSRTSRFTRAFAVSACVGPSGQGWAEDVAWDSDENSPS